jgi:hypothetical protein
MVSMTLLAVLGLGLTSTVLHSRRMAELAVYQASVHSAAAGYLEQLKAMSYVSLAEAELPTLPEAIKSGVWNTPPPIDINNTPGNTNDDIVFRIRPLLINLATATNPPLPGLQCYEMVIEYEYDTWIFGRLRTYRSDLRFIRSQVPTY